MKPSLLLVDDNSEILEYLSRMLEEKYSIFTARDGEKALALLKENSVQLVVSDVMMPVMDGFEFCKTIKSSFDLSHIPVILLTAKNTLQSKIEGLELGADVYIEKPFSPEHLQVQIASLLLNRNKVREYFTNSPVAQIHSMAFTSSDEAFLGKVQEIVHAHMEDADLDVEHLARYMNMSRPTLYRKLNEITDLTPSELINITRLKKAAILLKAGKYNINEIAEIVGYTNATHFGRNFQKQFGITPSEFLRKGE